MKEVTSMRRENDFRDVVPLLIGLSLAVGSVSGCNRAVGQTRSAGEAIPSVDVTLTTASVMKVPRVMTLSGTLVGNEQAKVAAGAAGKIVATHVERGQVVRKGMVLARLDGRAVRAQADEAMAQLESLKAQWSQAEIDCARTQSMFDKGAISKAEHDRSNTQCKTSKWSVSAAEARKSFMTEALRDTLIRAPFSGMVVERNVTMGEYVRPDSVIATLVDVAALRVELTVPEADLLLVRKGSSIVFRTAGHSDKGTYKGKILYIGPSVRQQSRDAVIEAMVENGLHELRPGMFVTAQLALGELALPTVPEAAVRIEGGQRHVFVEVGGRLEDRLVQTADETSGMIPVKDGLKAGDRVVAQLTPVIRDGMRLK
jgi:membrane fusion protein (multidrug efflux system)